MRIYHCIKHFYHKMFNLYITIFSTICGLKNKRRRAPLLKCTDETVPWWRAETELPRPPQNEKDCVQVAVPLWSKYMYQVWCTARYMIDYINEWIVGEGHKQNKIQQHDERGNQCSNSETKQFNYTCFWIGKFLIKDSW